MKEPAKKEFSEHQIVQRRDDAIRRALNTPPKPHKEIKGKKKRRQSDSASPSK